MIEQTGNVIKFLAFFVATKVGKSGLADVTVDVYDPTGTQVETDASATEVGGGVYSYSRPAADEGEWIAVFKTADATVDQQHIPALWVIGRAGIENLDSAVSDAEATASDALGAVNALVIPTPADNAEAVWDEAMAGHATPGSAGVALTAAGETQDPLESAVPGGYAEGTAGYVLGTVGTGAVVTVGPVVGAGDTLDLVRGDDYSDGENRAITFSSADWPDLTSAVVTLTVRRRREAFSTGSDGVLFAVEDVASMRTAGGGMQSVSFEPGHDDTEALLPGTGTGKFDVQATLALTGRVVTLVTGTVDVTEDQTRAPGTQWTIYGIYQDGGAVPQAGTVYLWDADDNAIGSATAGADGLFQFDGLNPDVRYYVTQLNVADPGATNYGDGDTAADNRLVLAQMGPV